MHHLTDTLAAKVAIAVNTETVAPIHIIEGEPVRLVCPFASTGLRATDLKMASAIADDFLATQPPWLIVVAVQFADGYTVLRADLTRYNQWVEGQ
jgi:hypothetical protein